MCMRVFISEIIVVAISVMVVMAIAVVRMVPPIFNLISSGLGEVCRNEKLLPFIFIFPELERDIPWFIFGRLRRNTMQKSEPKDTSQEPFAAPLSVWDENHFPQSVKIV